MGTLYLVGTPIGNLGDITYRAVQVLKDVDLIACEDTRVARKLCSHYAIDTPLKSYHEHNKEQQTNYLIEQLQNGLDIALVSDAGLPLISDPGYELVVEAREQQLNVVPIPGANAGLTALMASGLPSYIYTFIGFLPRKEKDKISVLQERMYQEATIIIYESPYRVIQTLKAIQSIDAKRRVTIGRELTKKFEEIVTLDIDSMIAMVEQGKIPQKGEFVMLIEGAKALKDKQWYEEMTIQEHVTHYIKKQQVKPKKAIKMVAEDRNMKTSDVYDIYHQLNAE
ncbi:16S rRNA (cytidine(1402)-2'-O)-methyltransferase [Staphylococcus lugdunensis]|uniref:16S rRNA (cytidine(1402)-2'-O)-methyltransferase n=1 Tax=Staphylococcus lugdunensis TaxID=28035 RepID=UPI001F4D108E|nr:16S rRNA (cytidine(1402)-2'-O)-methyltransferase [Staphylococcus lugdunensis]MCH8648061.1 16S rRNA (cytidine(1402)-2'-O)-methyltransferase [Staphylococcus lugdunensis]